MELKFDSVLNSISLSNASKRAFDTEFNRNIKLIQELNNVNKYLSSDQELILGKLQRFNLTLDRFGGKLKIPPSYKLIGDASIFEEEFNSNASKNPTSKSRVSNMSFLFPKDAKDKERSFRVINNPEYEKIEERVKKRINLSNKLEIYEHLPLEIKKKLECQEKIFNKALNNIKNEEKMSKIILKKTKKNESQILMKQTLSQMIKNQITNTIENQKENNLHESKVHWVLSLRKNEIVDKKGVFVNTGTDKKPIFTFFKEKPKNNHELIFAPFNQSYFENMEKIRSSKHFRWTTKPLLQNVNEIKLKELPELRVEGKNLFSEETHQISSMKGKKILHRTDEPESITESYEKYYTQKTQSCNNSKISDSYIFSKSISSNSLKK